MSEVIAWLYNINENVKIDYLQFEIHWSNKTIIEDEANLL